MSKDLFKPKMSPPIDGESPDERVERLEKERGELRDALIRWYRSDNDTELHDLAQKLADDQEWAR